ncbi:MAG: TRAP transporter small permease subunit [Rhizobiaceae bacterium]|nr:TRAP transporter small permease subunit [Rhizobiaceae bacterium]
MRRVLIHAIWGNGMADHIQHPVWLKTLDKVLVLLGLIGGGATLVFMVFVSSFNVIVMRKALSSPLQGAEDTLILSLVMLVAFAIPFGGRVAAHIEIEIFESRMSAGFARWSMIVMRAVASGLMLVMTYQLIHAGSMADKFGESTQQLLIFYEPFYYLLAFGVGLYVLVLTSDIFQLIKYRSIKQLDWGESL